MGHVIGIDLGTTNTAVSVVVDGRPKMLEDSHGYKVVPSVVWVGDDGTIKVGQQCKSLLVTDPSRTAFAVKRLIGRLHGSPEAEDADPRVGYDIERADDGGCLVALESGTFTPVEISAHVLRTAKEMAERALGGTVDEAVITVPAYFNSAQRTATMDAAQAAGLRCERLLSEPTAAALAYGFRKELDRTLLIFDLGGGTFDVSVLKLSNGVYEILSTLGDSYLGGEDFDHRVVDWIADRFKDQHGIDLREDRMTLHRLKEAAERAKCELSFTESVNINIPHIANGLSVEDKLDRDTLIGLVSDYVERSLDVALNAVRDAGIDVGDVDDVILVGGQTRMPAIREAITSAFGKEPSRSVHPEEVVAMGAAVHAASLAADSSVPAAVLIDVTPFDLGIDVAGNMFQPIISRNSTIPASASRVFATARANQASVQVTVRQGSSRVATENEFLGEFVMSGLTPAPRMETKVEVTFQIDTNGMLRVTAMEPATGKQTQITVRNYSEVAQSKGEVKANIERAADAPDPSDAGPDPVEAEEASAAPAKVVKTKTSKGGLIGALFGRRKKTVKRAPAPKTEPDSIIEQVVAEREAAQEAEVAEIEALPLEASEPAVGEPVDAMPIQLPEVDPTALEALEPDMDEPAPIDMPDLDPSALAPLDTEEAVPLGKDDLVPLDEDALSALDDEPVDAAVAVDLAAAAQAFADELAQDSNPDVGDPGIAPEPAPIAPEPEPAPVAPEPDPDPALVAPEPAPIAPEPEPAPVAPEPEPAPVAPEPEPAPAAPAPKKKPAKLKLSYKNPSSVVREYTENLRKGGSFIKTSKPLPVGREVIIEVRVPAIADDPIVIPGEVTWSSRDLENLGPDEVPGMGIEYRLDAEGQATLQSRLAEL